MEHRKFSITVTLATGETVSGIREFTATKLDPQDYFTYKAKKYYRDQFKKCEVTEILESFTRFEADKREKDPDKPKLGDRK